MIIEQFYDKGLAHGSYAIVSNGKMLIIDPARDPKPYFEFANKHQASIEGIIETHPHADFVSSHLEISQKTGAQIYVSRLVGAKYPHVPFDEGDVITLGQIKLKALNTPGHSPDSICVLLLDEQEAPYAVFTGDTLFVGDVGRPDLREQVGTSVAKKEELARAMYHSLKEKLMPLPEHVWVYPAHGAGSLCGKSLGHELYSNIGKELRTNYALQINNELEFVKKVTEDQLFIPKYFGHDVVLNIKGAPALAESIAHIQRIEDPSQLEQAYLLLDTRPEDQFKNGHLKNAFNLPDGSKFETWLGAIIAPEESFYLMAADEDALDQVIQKAAKIGYESQIKGVLIAEKNLTELSPLFELDAFIERPETFTIVDIRNLSEIKTGKIFHAAYTIPLPELRERIHEIPRDRPIVVHCAGGYRSAIGASILQQKVKEVAVFDMSHHIAQFIGQHS